ncbi:MAG: conjugal transfer protein TraG N-terminal domain-containing protein, partial [Gammaproteobacteria bacterium]
MQAYEIITYGGGDVLNGVFEAIARMRNVGNGSVISGLIIIAVLCGYIKTMFTNALDSNINSSIKWVVSVIIFLSFMYVPTVSVVICDKTINQSRPIAKIPLGIALLASVTSQVGHLLAQEFEDQFNIPKESHRRYTKYGTLFSSSLINAASQFEIVSPRIERNFRNFARQCVLYDVRIGAHYTLDDLVYANNGWKLIKERTSSLRMFDYHDGIANQVVTCKNGAQKLDQDLTKEAERHTKVFNWRFFAKADQPTGNDEFSIKKSQLAQNYLTSQIPGAHGFLTKMSGNATDILKQHMVRNAIKDSVIKNAQIVGANAAAQGFAIARAQEHQRNTFQIIGSFAARNLPELSICMQAILYGSSMFIFLLAVQPGGFVTLKRFMGIVVWIQSWPPLFAIVNYIQTEKLRSATLAAASYVDQAGNVA